MNRRYFTILLSSLIYFPSCKEMTAAKGLAEAAIIDFHKQFNDGKFKELYTAAHPDLRAATTEADFLKLVEAVNRKLGKHVRSSEKGVKIKSFNMKTVAVISQNTEFEHGKGVEIFTFVVSGNSCTLQGYHINSPDLLTN